MSELYKKSLKQIRDSLAGKEVSVTEAVRACLERIEATNEQINSMLHVELAAEQALRRAEELDREGPQPGKPLWGVPVAVKDCICTKDLPTTCCSRMLANFVPFYDAYVVERLKACGAVIIGKTNMDEFAMGSGTESSFFGQTRNPWNQKLIPGGSSGGSAAAVAAGQCFGALGTDTGGSVRQPASMCGCVGVKPTYGRVSRFGAIGFASSLDQVGLFASNVEDGAILLEAIAGLDERDSTCSARAVEAYSRGLPGELKGIKIGLPKEFWQAEGIAPEVLREAEKAVAAARDLGAELVDVEMPHMPLSVASYYIIAPAEASTNLSKFDGLRYGFRAEGVESLDELYEQSRTQGFGEEVKRRIMLGSYVLSSGYYDAYYKKASQVRRLIQQDYLAALEKCDALLAPISPVTAWEIGKHSSDPLQSYLMDIFTVSLNLAGLPGLAIPAGLGSDSGMPVGVQLLGRAFDEDRLFKISYRLEQAIEPIGRPRL